MSSTSLRASIAIGLLAFFSGLFASSVTAQEYPLQDGELRIEDDEQVSDVVRQGSSILLSGTGFAPGSTVVITAESDPIELASAVADATGTFSVTVRIPSTLDLGSHTLKATGEGATGGTLVLAQSVSVADTDGNLPLTGADSSTMLLLAGGLLALGATVLVAGRRVFARAG
ncbi:MAG: LPXTG cell wall anchor domain-containing protein [Actinomycetia bacterium]|nr:LPXTG cell wall anchor domain-containing protein [Actinomycetes bacterium]